MNSFKKIFLVFVFLAFFSITNSALASTPTLSMSLDSTSSSLVTLTVNGDANSGVILYYYSTNTSGPQAHHLGTTNSSGYFSTSIGLSDYNIVQNSSISVSVNGQQSATAIWTYSSNTTSGTLTLSQSSITLKVGQTNTITTSNNGSYTMYLSTNTNPQVANLSISGNQITATGLTSGQTSATFCLINSTVSGTNCATLYIIVQTSTSGSLTFSQSDTSIISGQNTSITISGGTGFYQIQNNSNPSVIGTSLNGPTLTLYANGTTGSSTIAICSTDLSLCGIIKASIGTYTSSGTGLSISQTYPTITTGSTQVITVSGGYGTYYISSNSNSAIVQTYISGSSLTLYGSTPGTTNIIICAPSGACGTIVANVVSSYSGALALSQNALNLSSGQIVSVTITGGTSPYSIIQNNDGIAQYSLSGSILTITAVSTGSSSASVCSSGGACTNLTVTVTGTTATASGVLPSFSQNNISINTSQTSAIYLSGNGGYYVSNNSNINVVSASISGSSVVLYGVTIGSANITICQTGGQCNTLYVTVNNSTTSTVSSVPITFSKSSMNLSVNEASNVTVSGGSGSGYYISYNSNSSSIGTYMAGSELIVSGKLAGSGTISVCSSANVCGTISITVSSTTVTSSTVSNAYIFTYYLKPGSSGTAVTKLQQRLTSEGVYSGPITGYYGSLTTAAVKKYQKSKGLDQIGVVGPQTRAALNK